MRNVNLKARYPVISKGTVYNTLDFLKNHGVIKEITIEKGEVNFPHYLHHDTIGDCNVCHDLFPKTAGIIKDLKEQKKLKKKQVMNKTCIKCHKAKRNAGEKTGPIR